MRLKKIDKSDIIWLKKYFEDIQPEFSQYSLSSIFLWDQCIYDAYLTYYRDIPVFIEVPYDVNDKRRVLFPLSKEKLKPSEIYELIKTLECHEVYYVDEDYIRKYKHELEKYFDIQLQDEYSDYLYRASELSELKGSKYSAKRNLINQFEKTYASGFQIKPFKKQTLNDIIYLIDKIKNQISAGNNIDIYICEEKAIKRISYYIDDIIFFGICVYIAGELKAFAIGSHLNRETCILNFEKADKNIKGLYQFTDREFSKIASERYIFINKESDMGKEGLRKAKQSYHPIKIIKSFILKTKI